MKNFLALVAVVLCLLVAYQMHRDRLAAQQKAAEESAPFIVKKLLSECLDPYRRDLLAKYDDRRPTDLVPPLDKLKAQVIANRDRAEPAVRGIHDAGLVAVERMLAAAEQRRAALQQLLDLGARPTSSLERTDSSNTSSAFFKESALRKAEAQKTQWQPGIDQALAQLRRAEASVAAALGAEAAQDDYGQRRMTSQYVTAQSGKEAGNPLNQAAYDRRQVIVPARERTQQNSGSSAY
jgi:hypothetical protein